jgi:hypothetical protein
MAITNAAQSKVKTVADPNAKYESLVGLWERNRAVCSGERFVKDFDKHLDVTTFTNLLLPFSPSMTPEQYTFYKAEAELPGITSQFAKMLVGGLLRKKPTLKLPDNLPEDTLDWLMNQFGVDDAPLTTFLDSALWEEVQTSRPWIFVDYPRIPNPEALTPQELREYKPYAIWQQGEAVINWRVKTNELGKNVLDRVVVRGFQEVYGGEGEENEFHPSYLDTVWVHELDNSGYYQIRTFQKSDEESNVNVISGHTQVDPQKNKGMFHLVDINQNIMANGNRLTFIPAWPLNGNIDPVEPMLTAIVDKEIALYNKISRRNHLLYGASTYTPIISSDMTSEKFDEIVSGGLGTWLHLEQGDTATVLKTPTEALADMDKAIAGAIEEMAKLGIRMLTPEVQQSGIALEIRNAAQTAQLGTLNSKIGSIMQQVICCMINWRLGTDLNPSDIEFSLSEDFNPVPFGQDWIRLATEWYQEGLIPRSAWIMMLKMNDLLPPDYNDKEAKQEINADEFINNNASDNSYVQDLDRQKPLTNKQVDDGDDLEKDDE